MKFIIIFSVIGFVLAAIYSNCVSRHAVNFTLYSCHGDSMAAHA